MGKKSAYRPLAALAAGPALVAALFLGACGRGPAPTATLAPATATTMTGGGTMVFGTTLVPVLGVVVDSQLRVVDLDPGGAAERAGLLRGDTLTRIAGRGVGSAAEGKAAFRDLARAGQTLTLTARRSDRTIEVQATPTSAPAGSAGLPTPTAIPAAAGLDYL